MAQVPDPCWQAVQGYVSRGMDAEAVTLAFVALQGQLQDSTVRSVTLAGHMQVAA